MISVEPIEWATASDADIRAFHRLNAAVERDAGVPDALVEPYELVARELRNPRPLVHRRAFALRDGDDLAAVSRCGWEDVDENRDHVSVGVTVEPRQRGRGLERLMLRPAVEAACDEFAARLLDAEERIGSPGLEVLLDLDFEVRLRSPCNVMWTRDLDRARMQEWVDRAAERATDYELISWDGACPDEHVDAFRELWRVMNTAPREDLDWEDETLSLERLRAWERHDAARGVTPWVVVARHIPTGEFAGFTVLAHLEMWRTVTWQEDTGVQPAHRNRGLGRWLKATNALRLIEDAPEVQAVTTWNAGSNEPMLGINHAMGFAPLEWWGELQAEAKAVRDLLAAP